MTVPFQSGSPGVFMSKGSSGTLRNGRAAIVALSIFVLVGAIWLFGPRFNSADISGGVDTARIGQASLHAMVYSYCILLLPQMTRLSLWPTILALVGMLIIGSVFSLDLTALRYFDTAMVGIYQYLPVRPDNFSVAGAVSYARLYIPQTLWFLAVSGVVVAASLSNIAKARSAMRVWVLIAGAAIYLASLGYSAISRDIDPQVEALMNEPELPQPTPKKREPIGFSAGETPADMPGTVILIVMESVGMTQPASDPDRLLAHRIMQQGDARDWVRFTNAVTVSNASDVTIPTMLKGSGSHDGKALLDNLPFVSQYAQARDYRTEFLTSGSMHFAQFEEFFGSAGFDAMHTADNSGLPLVNDLAVDDFYMYDKAAQSARRDGDLFMLLYPKSLHWPYQTKSAFDIPEEITDRRSRAAYIQEAGMAHLTASLRAAGRYDDAMIVIIGDHGEFDYGASHLLRQMRLTTFDGGILSPIMMVKPPRNYTRGKRASLVRNADRLVGSIDIAPTFASMFGMELAGGHTFGGHDLFADVPPGRVVYSTATNEWRRWPKTAIAVSRGHDRLICDTAHLCRRGVSKGGVIRGLQAADHDDGLFRRAMTEPGMRAALGQIHRAHYD